MIRAEDLLQTALELGDRQADELAQLARCSARSRSALYHALHHARCGRVDLAVAIGATAMKRRRLRGVPSSEPSWSSCLEENKTVSNLPESYSAGKAEQNVRAELARLRARYDGGAVPQAIFTIIRTLECELAWIEHGKGDQHAA